MTLHIFENFIVTTFFDAPKYWMTPQYYKGWNAYVMSCVRMMRITHNSIFSPIRCDHPLIHSFDLFDLVEYLIENPGIFPFSPGGIFPWA